MNEIFNYISGWGEDIEVIKDDGEISHIYWSFEDNYFCAVMPHSGNGFRYMLRVNPKDTFDRWSVADTEIFSQDAEGIIMYLISKY